MSTHRGNRSKRCLARDYSSYVLIGFALIGGVAVAKAFDVSHESFVKWGGLAFFSPPVLATFLVGNRPNFKHRKFWALFATIVGLHTAVFVTLLMNVTPWRYMWPELIFSEMVILSYLSDYLNRTLGGR